MASTGATAKAVQRYLHNQLGVSNQDPLGWDNQISDGGELTALYSAERSPEFKGPEAREHYWAGLYVTCEY